MSDFLDFLNTADFDTLAGIPGITRPLAANIIAARPFDFVEDCLHVTGMDKNLLGSVQSHFEAEINSSRNRTMLPVGHETLPPGESAGERSTFRARLGEAFANVFRSFLRLIITLAAIAIIGTALYFGLPYIINKDSMAPVEQNTAQIDQLEAEISALKLQLDETNSRVDALENSVEMHTASLDRLKVMQSTLEETLQENDDEVLLELKHEIMTTRALDMLGRARLYLAQGDSGPAKGDVRSARELLAELQTETRDSQFEDAIAHLNLALANLPASPSLAAADLEIAWQFLLTGEAPPADGPQSSPAFTPTPDTTVTATP